MASAIAILVPILLIIFSFLGLSWMESVPFYKNSGDIDSMRIPLIEPYKAVKLNGSSGEKNGWSIDLIIPPEEKEIYYYTYLYDVTKVAVENNVIMAYSPDSISLTDDDKRVGQKVLYWFVIVPDQKIETGFETEEEFLTYIHTLGIESPSWIETNEAYRQFVKTRCLDWIPDCK